MKKIYIKHIVMKLKNRQDVSNVLNYFTSKNVINKIILNIINKIFQDVFKIDIERNIKRCYHCVSWI